MLEENVVKIDQQPWLVASEPQTGQDLGFRDQYDLVSRFELDDKLICHDEVHHVSAIEVDPLIDQWQRHLLRIIDAALAQLAGKTLFAGRLEEPGAELTMNFDRRPDHRSCDLRTKIAMHDSHSASSASLQ